MSYQDVDDAIYGCGGRSRLSHHHLAFASCLASLHNNPCLEATRKTVSKGMQMGPQKFSKLLATYSREFYPLGETPCGFLALSHVFPS